MTDQKIIEVVTAHQNGVLIQFRVKDTEEWVDLSCSHPIWNFEKFDYRIKPKEPNCRPYKSAVEFLKDFEIHGPFVHSKISGAYRSIIHLAGKGSAVVLGNEDPGRSHDMQGLLRDYTWQDEHPCGIYE